MQIAKVQRFGLKGMQSLREGNNLLSMVQSECVHLRVNFHYDRSSWVPFEFPFDFHFDKKCEDSYFVFRRKYGICKQKSRSLHNFFEAYHLM